MNQRTHHDLDHVVSLIQSFEALPEQQLTAATIHKYQKRLDDIAAVYQHDERAGSDRFVLYELQAMLLNAQGNTEQASEYLEQALGLKPTGTAFISGAAQRWEHRNAHSSTTEERSKAKRAFTYFIVVNIVCLLAIILLPNNALILVKIIAVTWLLSNLYGAWSNTAISYYAAMGPAVTVQSVLFGLWLLVGFEPGGGWLSTALFVLFVAHWVWVYKRINAHVL